MNFFLFFLFVFLIHPYMGKSQNMITYNEFKDVIENRLDRTCTYLYSVDRINKTSVIFYGFEKEDLYIKTINIDIDLSLYGDNHVNDLSQIYLYNSTESFLESLDYKTLQEIDTPYLRYKNILNNETNFQDILLNDLFSFLELDRPNDLLKINFNNFNLAIKMKGYETIKDRFYIHLIVFCGVYLNSINTSGYWKFSYNVAYPFVPEPIYMEEEVSTLISINHFLGKELLDAKEMENNNVDHIFEIQSILEFSTIFKEFKKNVKINIVSE